MISFPCVPVQSPAVCVCAFSERVLEQKCVARVFQKLVCLYFFQHFVSKTFFHSDWLEIPFCWLIVWFAVDDREQFCWDCSCLEIALYWPTEVSDLFKPLMFSVASVWLSCLTSNFWQPWPRISTLGSYIKVIRSQSRSQEQRSHKLNFEGRSINNLQNGVIPLIFTARRYASAVLAVIVCPSVCLSVCLSVTSRSCTKKAKPRIRLTTPYDSPETSSPMPKILAKFPRHHPQRGCQIEVG